MRLETWRLTLRPWEESDVVDLIEGLNNHNVSKWLSRVPFPFTGFDSENWLNYCASIDQKSNYEFAIELKSEGKVIGGLSLNRVDPLQGTASGGIWLNEKYQGKGYGTEAFAEKIRFAFMDLDLRRLENGCFPGNASSQKMLYRLGYSMEGMKRSSLVCLADGEYKDEILCGLLRDDWIRFHDGEQGHCNAAPIPP